LLLFYPAALALSLALSLVYFAAISANERIAHANQRASEADGRAEQARAENVALARAAVSRHVVASGIGPNPMLRGYLTDLGQFRGTSVFIQAADDADAINFSGELVTALTALGWKAEIIDEPRSHVSPKMIMEGVSVVYPVGKPYTEKEPNQPWFAWAKAAEALANALTTGGFGVGDIPVNRFGFTNEKQDFLSPMIPFFDPPLEGVYVQVGARPISMTFQWVEQRRKHSP
jgi:hypothetical protein